MPPSCKSNIAPSSFRQQPIDVMQVVKDHDYSKAADVYSFGIIMWEMMTWRLPWEELNPFQVCFRLRPLGSSLVLTC